MKISSYRINQFEYNDISYDEMVVVPDKTKNIFIVTYDVDYANGTYKTIMDIIHHDYPGFKETSYIIQLFSETEFYDWFSKEEWLDKFELGHYILTHATCAFEDTRNDWKRAR